MAELADAEPFTDLAGGFEPADRDQWLQLVDKVLRGRPLQSLHSRTADGLDIAPLYTAGPGEDVTGAPGAVPFTRAFTADQREDGRWGIRAVVDSQGAEGAPSATDELEGGATSLLLGGAALESTEALATALRGVHLDLAPVVLEPASAFVTTAQWLMDLWESEGVGDDAAAGGFGADPVAVLARSGELPQGIDRALADGAGLASMSARRMPRVRAFTVDATVYAEAGASEAIEIAALLSTTVTYLRSMQDAGMGAAAASSQIEYVIGADPDFFTTIAKIRAARTVLAAVLEACGADPATGAPVLVARTLRRSLSRRDPWVNMLRVTSGAFAAALGGADVVVTAPFDVLLGEPSPLGRRMARNTQLLLAEESHVGRVIDPAGGSWYVESLTEAIADRAWEVFTDLESAGGMPAVLADGTLARRIEGVREPRLTAVATRTAPLTGVSEFPNLEEDLPATAPRPGGAPPEVDATDERSVCDPVAPVRWAEPFERLRDAADRRRDEGGDAPAPRVFLANLGSVATHTARATWARNFFEAGGLAARSSERGTSVGFGSADEVAEDFRADGALLVCICSSDEVYAETAGAVAAALRSAGARRVYLAGRPGEDGEELRSAGVDTFVHVGVDLLDVLTDAHEVLGIEPAGDHEGDRR